MVLEVNVLIPIFPGFDLLDLTNPLHVLGRGVAESDKVYFHFTIASNTEYTESSEGVTIKADVSFEHVTELVAGYHILIQPGGPIDKIAAYRGDETTLHRHLRLIDHFTTLSPISGEPYMLFSVGTGALLIADTGAFGGMKVTTRVDSLEALHRLCEAARERTKGEPATVVPAPVVQNIETRPIFRAVDEQRKKSQAHFRLTQGDPVRWVDGGVNSEYSNRVISCGGGSCAIDASLFLVSELESMERAKEVAREMEYAWRWA